jgi:hypothetical protein
MASSGSDEAGEFENAVWWTSNCTHHRIELNPQEFNCLLTTNGLLVRNNEPEQIEHLKSGIGHRIARSTITTNDQDIITVPNVGNATTSELP